MKLEVIEISLYWKIIDWQALGSWRLSSSGRLGIWRLGRSRMVWCRWALRAVWCRMYACFRRGFRDDSSGDAQCKRVHIFIAQFAIFRVFQEINGSLQLTASISFLTGSTFIRECYESNYGVSYVGNQISLHLNISSRTIETVHVRYMRLIYKPTLIRKTFISYFVVAL